MKKILVFMIIIISLLVVISFIKKDKTNFILKKNNDEKNIIEKLDKNITKEEKNLITINVSSDNELISLELEEYIIGVIACEMPASFHEEALKAQAVAARTFVLNRMSGKENYTIEDSTSAQCYQSILEMKQKWKNNFEKYYTKIKNAVYSTEKEYLTYNNKIITAFYFSMSNGYTEYSENVFSSSRPYLKSVESSWEKENKDFEKTISFNTKTFLKKLNLNGSAIKTIKILSRYDTNRVKEIQVNNQKFTGVKFRSLLGIRSTDFDISYDEETINITTRGYGHGVGMSQYGANGMALLGYSYEEILKYYYQNVEIKKYN